MSLDCNPASARGGRFKRPAAIQVGWQQPGGALPDNGVAARYGLARAESSGTLEIVLSYAPDGEEFSWSPGGGSALVSDAREHEQMIDEWRAENQGSTPATEDEATSAPTSDEQ